MAAYEKHVEEAKEFEEVVINIDRVSRVVKGGRRLRFRATVVIGNRKGKVGVGIGKSIHAGMVVVADGTKEAEERLERVLTYDPGMGIMRHADAGYQQAIDNAKKWNVKIPMLK